MGAFLAVLAEVFELSTVTGLSVETILSGEAFTTAELLQSHIANLVTFGGLTEAEALAAAEVSAEAFSALSSLSETFPQAFASLAATEFATTGTLTVGAAIAAALYPYYYDYSVPISNLNRSMALQQWIPDYDIDFPGIRPLVRFLNYIDPYTWASDLYHSIGRYFWETAQRIGQNVIEEELTELTRELAVRTVFSMSEMIALYFENARWAVSLLPRSIYNSLETYYAELPGINPIQARQLYRRLGEVPLAGGPISGPISGGPVPQQFSAQYVERYPPPGGADQRTAADWMLPLILGLYGDISPSWRRTLEDLEEEEDGPQKKKSRRA
ncbi:minor capsid protein VP2 [Rhinolophus blasii polyomavirus 1]|nr:minor capsid protein VP2 [Rhinolophus blasii polyomavirus 1]BAZ96602.1 minor capsid protein VP2 [Rhinolophus simulator polyomavirus 4]